MDFCCRLRQLCQLLALFKKIVKFKFHRKLFFQFLFIEQVDVVSQPRQRSAHLRPVRRLEPLRQLERRPLHGLLPAPAKDSKLAPLQRSGGVGDEPRSRHHRGGLPPLLRAKRLRHRLNNFYRVIGFQQFTLNLFICYLRSNTAVVLRQRRFFCNSVLLQLWNVVAELKNKTFL